MNIRKIINSLCVVFVLAAFGTNIYIAATDYGFDTTKSLLAQNSSNSAGSSNSNGAEYTFYVVK